MKPVDNWADVLKYAWSVRFMLAAAILSAAEAAWPWVQGLLPVLLSVTPPGWVSPVLMVAAIIARFVAQRNVSP